MVSVQTSLDDKQKKRKQKQLFKQFLVFSI